MERRRLIAGAAGAVLLSLAPCQIAWGAKLVNVRMWPAAEYTRVTIETDEPLKYKHFFVRSAKPLRLVIDIEGLALTERIKKLIAFILRIRRMKSAKFSPVKPTRMKIRSSPRWADFLRTRTSPIRWLTFLLV